MSIETKSAIDETRALIVRATGVKVNTLPTRQDAATLWSLIRSARKSVEAEQEKVCGPLKTAYEDARQPYLELRKECEAWEKRLQTAMAEWDREQDRLARIEQAKIQAKIDAQNSKAIAKAEAKGQDVSEVVLKAAPIVQAPAKSIETQAGTKQTRITKKVYTAKDLASLMRDFPSIFDLNQAKFNKLGAAGMLDGRADVEITEEYVYAQRGSK